MRLSISDIDAFPRFAYVPERIMTVDSLCFFSGKELKQLVNILNSEYSTYYFFSNVATLDNGGFQMRQQYVENILLPRNLSLIHDDKDVYKCFEFNESEVQYIKAYIAQRKEEIVSNNR